MRRIFLTAAVFACSVTLWGTAEAGFTVCNRSSEDASVAVGFLDGDKGWTAQGWSNVAKGECATIVSGDLTGSYIYLLVDGDRLIPPASQQGGWFCTDNDGFRTRNQDYSDDQRQLLCEAAGLQTEHFRELTIKGKNATFTLK